MIIFNLKNIMEKLNGVQKKKGMLNHKIFLMKNIKKKRKKFDRNIINTIIIIRNFILFNLYIYIYI